MSSSTRVPPAALVVVAAGVAAGLGAALVGGYLVLSARALTRTLATASTAPISSAARVTSVPAAVRVETMTTGMGRSRMIFSRNSSPFMLGISTSRVMTSGFRALIAARACTCAAVTPGIIGAGSPALRTEKRSDPLALAAAAVLERERMARSFAQEALSRLGIGQIVLDAGARVIAADPLAERHLAFLAVPGPRPARKLLLPAPAAERIERCCAAFAAAAPGLPPEPVLVAVEGRPPLLLRPAPAPIAATPGPRPVAIAALRLPVREDETRGAAVLRELYRLSPREAALAARASRHRRPDGCARKGREPTAR